MLYSFARVSAVIGMRRQDYFRQESRGGSRLPVRTTAPQHPQHRYRLTLMVPSLVPRGIEQTTTLLLEPGEVITLTGRDWRPALTSSEQLFLDGPVGEANHPARRQLGVCAAGDAAA